MGRLIDVDKAEKMLRKYADDVGCNRGEIELANGILKAVCYLGNIPTAYDVEKVIEELEGCIADTTQSETGVAAAWAYRGAINIVKAGGKNDHRRSH